MMYVGVEKKTINKQICFYQVTDELSKTRSVTYVWRREKKPQIPNSVAAT